MTAEPCRCRCVYPNKCFCPPEMKGDLAQLREMGMYEWEHYRDEVCAVVEAARHDRYDPPHKPGTCAVCDALAALRAKMEESLR